MVSTRLRPFLVALLATAVLGRGSSRGGEPIRAQRGPAADSALAFQVSPTYYGRGDFDLEEDTPHLIIFRGKGDDYCKLMEPMWKELESELGVRVRTFEVWHSSSNLELLRVFDTGECGGVPFFFNKRTRRFICGATTYDNMRLWALDQVCEPFLPPPNLNIKKDDSDAPELQRRVKQFFRDIQDKAAEKMEQTQQQMLGGGKKA